jgi:hypothetical protein
MLRLANVAEQGIPAAFRYDGQVQFVSDDEELLGLATSFLALGSDDDDGTLQIQGRLWPSGDYAKHGRVSAHGGHVFGDHAFCRFASDAGNETTFKLRLNELTVGKSFENAATTRESILGLRLRDHSFAASFHCEVFGRTALVADCASMEGGPIDSVQVVYEGGPIEEKQRTALHDVLRFVCGTRGSSRFTEGFDSDGKRLGFYVRNAGSANLPKQHLQPIDLRPGLTNSLARDFSTMLDKMLALSMANSTAVSATMHHYNDASVRTYPTSRLRDLLVALESLFFAFEKRPPTSKPMPATTDFDKRIKPVLDEFDRAFADVPDGEAHDERKRMREKIQKANMMSPRRELHDFFTARDIGFMPFERKLLDGYRNDIIHRGHHKDESRTENLRRNDEAAAGIANLFHRAFLRILGYDGEYRDAHSFTSHPLTYAAEYPIPKDRNGVPKA